MADTAKYIIDRYRGNTASRCTIDRQRISAKPKVPRDQGPRTQSTQRRNRQTRTKKRRSLACEAGCSLIVWCKAECESPCERTLASSACTGHGRRDRSPWFAKLLLDFGSRYEIRRPNESFSRSCSTVSLFRFFSL